MRLIRSQGFTLLELVVVLAIASLMIAVVPPLLSGLVGSAELRGTARQLAAGLRAARNEAVTRQHEAALVLDLEQRYFKVTGDARQVKLPDTVTIKLHTAESEMLDDGTGRIRFFPDGSSTGGHIALAGKRFGYTVNVDWLTGRIAIIEGYAPGDV